MEKYAVAIQIAASAVLAWISDKLGILFPVLCVLLVMMILDYITGMLASKREAIDHPDDPAYGWSSKKGAVRYVPVRREYLSYGIRTDGRRHQGRKGKVPEL